jgi:REP element-mobilizing transposase RayT
MRIPLGYHLTFHPYGTWLPGDDRGWSARPGEPVLLDRYPPLAAYARERLLGPPVFFDERQRAVITSTIVEVCAYRQWLLHAAAVHPDHIHVVVTADVAPEWVVNSLKSWSTRRLREAGSVDALAKIWARHGSTRYLDDERRVVVAIEYVVRQGGTRYRSGES